MEMVSINKGGGSGCSDALDIVDTLAQNHALVSLRAFSGAFLIHGTEDVILAGGSGILG
jgi:hypothetical protein